MSIDVLTIIIAAFIIYAVSIIQIKNWYRAAYSKEGRYDMKTRPLERSDMFLTILPVINTAIAFTSLFISPYNDESKINRVKKFFEIED